MPIRVPSAIFSDAKFLKSSSQTLFPSKSAPLIVLSMPSAMQSFPGPEVKFLSGIVPRRWRIISIFSIGSTARIKIACGTNNWEITKKHIDGDREIFGIFENIRDTSLCLREALIENDWTAVGEILRESYPQRKKLSPNITTPQMDFLIGKALQSGAIAAKVCGAGGGGCIAFFCEEDARPTVEKALAEEAGAEVLNWKLCSEGLIVKEISDSRFQTPH